MIDFEGVLIDANCPPAVKGAIIRRTQAEIDAMDTQGIEKPVLTEASVGRNARAVGAAALRIIERYLLSHPRFG